MQEGQQFSAYPLTALHDEINQYAQAAGLQVVDLLDAHRSYTSAELTLPPVTWFDPWHPNVLGHQIVAQQLTAAVQPFLAVYQ